MHHTVFKYDHNKFLFHDSYYDFDTSSVSIFSSLRQKSTVLEDDGSAGAVPNLALCTTANGCRKASIVN